MDRKRLYEFDDDVAVIRRDFEIQVKTMGLGEFQLVQKGPLHYEGPSWISSMWFGFLMARRTTFVYRDPRFEGDFVKGDTLAAFGIRLMDQDAGSASSDVRVPAGWVIELCAALELQGEMDEVDGAILARAKDVLERPGLRDVKEKK